MGNEYRMNELVLDYPEICRTSARTYYITEKHINHHRKARKLNSTGLSLLADRLIDNAFWSRDRLDRAISLGNLMGVVYSKGQLDSDISAIDGVIKRIRHMISLAGGKASGLSRDAIEAAKEYPFQDLLTEYGITVRMGRSACLIHGGKNEQSFTTKNNYGYCHSCGWNGDTISFVMEMDKCSFVDAVRKLS